MKINKKIHIALGSGGAKGWAHIGVLNALEKQNMNPSLITGSSMGAIVAACYANNRLEQLEKFAKSLTKIKKWSYFDILFPQHGLIRGKKIEKLIHTLVDAEKFEDLSKKIKIVATDYHTGKEVVYSKGPLLPALRASISVPGTLMPYEFEERVLIDGGVVNPLPSNLLGEAKNSYKIGVDVNHYPFKTSRKNHHIAFEKHKRRLPKVFDVLENTLVLMQKKCSENILKDSPVDLLITPALGEFWYTDYHRAQEIIQHGYESTIDSFKNL